MVASEEKMASSSPRAMLDRLNGAARHAQRVNLVVMAKSLLQWIRAFARARAEFDELVP